MLRPVHSERGGLCLDALVLDLPLGTFTELWVKACRGTHAETTRQGKSRGSF